MATLLAGATGNFTDASTWRVVAAGTSNLIDSESTSQTLTASAVASPTFVLAAVAVDAVAVKIAQRTNPGTGTCTVELYNATGGAVVGTCTINVTDFDACGTSDDNGGWYLFKFSGGSYTPNGTDNFSVRALTSSTGQVTLFRDATSNNWSRLIRTTTTQVPAAGDMLHLAGEWTAAATVTTLTVTMNETATTDYGHNGTVTTVPAFSINKGGVLAYGTTASTNYYLRISGHLNVYSGGLLTIGTNATPVPRSSTAVLEFDCGTNGAFGLIVFRGGRWDAAGQSRTSGKNVVQTRLTADLAAAGTALSVGHDTGWLNTDEIGIASTTRTFSQFESRFLSGDAGASSMTVSAGVTNAHAGNTVIGAQAHVVLLTRNVIVRGISTILASYVHVFGSGTVDLEWVMFRYIGMNAAGKYGLTFSFSANGIHTGNVDYCVFRDCANSGIRITTSASGSVITINDTVVYSFSVTVAGYAFMLEQNAQLGCAVAFNRCTAIGSTTGSSVGFYLSPHQGVLTSATDLVCSSNNGQPLQFFGPSSAYGHFASVTLARWEFYSNANTARIATFPMSHFTLDGLTIWRHNADGLRLEAAITNGLILDYYAFGNNGAAVWCDQLIPSVTFRNARFYGETAYTQLYGLHIPSTFYFGLRFEDCDFGAICPVGLIPLSTYDLYVTVARAMHDLVFDNCTFGGATIIGVSPSALSYREQRVRFQAMQGVVGDDRTYTGAGQVRRQTAVSDSGSAILLLPQVANFKLDTAAGQRGSGYLVAVAAGESPTISAKVRKDVAYTGNAPRLLLKSNATLGIVGDQVLDTHTAAADTWETLSGVVPSVAAAGVIECVVDCDGVAGAVYVDTFASGVAAHVPISSVNRAENTPSGVGLSSVATAGASHTAGNLLIVRMSYQDGGTATISDTAGNTWNEVDFGASLSVQVHRQRVFYAFNCNGHAANVVTAAFTASAYYAAISVRQFAGDWALAPTVNQAYYLDPTNATGTITTPTITVPAEESVLIGACMAIGQSIVAGTGYSGTAFSGGNGGYFFDQYKIDADGGNQTQNITFNASNSGLLGVAFTPA